MSDDAHGPREDIAAGRTSLGIELGSTRIKACLIGPDHTVLATGSHDWENQLVDGVWTYSLDAVRSGLQGAVASLLADCERRHGVRPTTVGALGVSAIGRVGATYSQNAKTLEEYVDLLDQGRLPIVRGLALTRDDLLRRAVIMSLMCQGELLFEAIDQGHLIDSRRYFARELEQLAEFAEQGLVSIDAAGVQVTDRGWYLVRAIAMVFDRHLQADQDRARFSRIL